MHAKRSLAKRRGRARLQLEELETRSLLAANVLPGSLPIVFDVEPNDTLVHAAIVGELNDQGGAVLYGAIDQPADVDWYTFQLDQATDVSFLSGGSSVVLSLYVDAPDDYFDTFTQQGVRQLSQGVGSLQRFLGAGTYHVAVSGAGNTDFNPQLAGSGLAGTTGAYQITVNAHALAPTLGAQILSSDAGAQFATSPFVLRVSLSAPLDVSTAIPGSTLFLTYHPTGAFGDGQDVDLAIDQVNFSDAALELQLTPAAPLGRGYYRLTLLGSQQHAEYVMDQNGFALGASAEHPAGQDVTIAFQVLTDEVDDTPATAHDLGDITDVGLVQVRGAIGDDPTDAVPFNPADVDLYHFEIAGPGNYAVFAEVFARRIGSPLNSGVSLFRMDPATGQLVLVAGNDDTQNNVPAADGQSLPLLSDSALFAGLTAGSYYLAVTSRKNVPDPLRDLQPGVEGIFDPHVSHSATAGTSIGFYTLNVFVQRDNTAPTVVSASIREGDELTQAPTQLTIQFSEAVNLQSLSYAAFQQEAAAALQSVYIESADGTRYFPRLRSLDVANRATFVLYEALPTGTYTLHLSGARGLTDYAGNRLVGNHESGDYVVSFTVDAPARQPQDWLNQEPNDSFATAQHVGLLFPSEVRQGIFFTRVHTSGASDRDDYYRIEVLQDQNYLFLLTNQGSGTPKVTLYNAQGVLIPTAKQGATGILGLLSPGTYVIRVTGWTAAQAPLAAYTLKLTTAGNFENPPPLTLGPAPALYSRLALGSESPPVAATPQPPPVTVSVAPFVVPPSPGNPAPIPAPQVVSSLPIFSALSVGPVGGAPAPRDASAELANRFAVSQVEFPLTLGETVVVANNPAPSETFLGIRFADWTPVPAILDQIFRAEAGTLEIPFLVEPEAIPVEPERSGELDGETEAMIMSFRTADEPSGATALMACCVAAAYLWVEKRKNPGTCESTHDAPR